MRAAHVTDWFADDGLRWLGVRLVDWEGETVHHAHLRHYGTLAGAQPLGEREEYLRVYRWKDWLNRGGNLRERAMREIDHANHAHE